MNLRQLFPILMSFMLFQQSGFGADPELEWSLFRGTMGQDSGQATAIDRWGNVRITGSTSGAFPGHSNEDGKLDGFLATYTHEPCRSFSAKQWGGAGHDNANSIAVDLLGYVHIVGHSSPAPNPTTGFYRKYDPLGRLCWEKQIDIGKNPRATACISDGCMGVLVTGFAYSDHDANGIFTFVRRYDRCGKELWTTRLGDAPGEKPSATRGNSLARLSNGDVLVAGSVWRRLDGEPTCCLYISL